MVCFFETQHICMCSHKFRSDMYAVFLHRDSMNKMSYELELNRFCADDFWASTRDKYVKCWVRIRVGVGRALHIFLIWSHSPCRRESQHVTINISRQTDVWLEIYCIHMARLVANPIAGMRVERKTYMSVAKFTVVFLEEMSDTFFRNHIWCKRNCIYQHLIKLSSFIQQTITVILII